MRATAIVTTTGVGAGRESHCTAVAIVVAVVRSGTVAARVETVTVREGRAA